MPFKSEAQRRFLWANNPQVAQRWADEYETPNKLPKQIVKRANIVDAAPSGNGKRPKFTAQSSSTPGKEYKLSLGKDGSPRCSCLGFRFKRVCKHVESLASALQSDQLESHGIKKIASAFYSELMKLAARNYKIEYRKFHSSHSSKIDRAHRNKIRRALTRTGRVHRHDGRDIDHRDGNPRNNSRDNVSVTSRAYNRGKH